MRRHKSEGAARRRTDVAFTLVAALCLAGFAFLVITMQALSHDLRTANQARDALAQQVQELGGTPVAGEPGSRGEVGPSGPPGRDGVDGRDAPTITPSPGKPGASGQPGKPGADSTVPGPSGAPGQPGADSTVPGPSGPPGRDGIDGKDGRDGIDGKDGQSCPEGYSWQTPPDDPDAKVCRRDGAPPPERGLLSSAALDPSRRQYP